MSHQWWHDLFSSSSSTTGNYLRSFQDVKNNKAMLRLITFATHQQTQEMSFLRRLICYSRYILRNHQILLGRRKVEVSPENQSGVLLRTEGKKGCNIIVGGGNVGTAGPRASSELGGAAGRSSTDSGGSSFSSSTLSRIGQQIHTQVRQIFINNVLRRATTNQVGPKIYTYLYECMQYYRGVGQK